MVWNEALWTPVTIQGQEQATSNPTWNFWLKLWLCFARQKSLDLANVIVKQSFSTLTLYTQRKTARSPGKPLLIPLQCTSHTKTLQKYRNYSGMDGCWFSVDLMMEELEEEDLVSLLLIKEKHYYVNLSERDCRYFWQMMRECDPLLPRQHSYKDLHVFSLSLCKK